MDSSYNFISTKYQIDRKLYKYYSNTQYAIDCIRNRRIHLDNPKTFNDPFDAAFKCPNLSLLVTTVSETTFAKQIIDCLHSIPNEKRGLHSLHMLLGAVEYAKGLPQSDMASDARSTKTDIEKMYNSIKNAPFTFEDFLDEIDKGYIETRRVMHLNCRISCFSEISDSILMWSYYANKHNGICIEFDLSRLPPENELNAQILKNISKVHYSPIRADLQDWGINCELNFLSSKADVWEHEHEWRLVCETQEEYLPFDCISGVYVGANFDIHAPKYKELVKAVNTHEALIIKQCKLSTERYAIDFHELYDSYFYKMSTSQLKGRIVAATG